MHCGCLIGVKNMPCLLAYRLTEVKAEADAACKANQYLPGLLSSVKCNQRTMVIF